jgi:hypothetical protein
MKTILRLSTIAALAFLLAGCGEPLDRTPDLAIEIQTGTFDPNGPSIEGRIVSQGDGILHYGHMWTEAPHQGIDCPEVMPSKSSLYTASINPGEPFFTDLSALATGTYYIRAYLVDVHSVTYCSEEVPITIGGDFSVGFEIGNNNCEASCEVIFTNTSSANATSFQWFIEGELVAETRDYSHSFDVPGEYEIRMEATDGLITKTVTDDVTIAWLKYELPKSDYGPGIGILPHPDGGYVIAGNNDGDVYMIKIDQRGAVDSDFDVKFEATNNDKANAFIFLPFENTYVVVGESSHPSNGNTDIFIGKVSISGSIIDESRFGISSNTHDEEALGIAISSTNKLLVTGRYSHPNDDSTRIHSFWLKMNADFSSKFDNPIYHPQGGNLIAQDIIELSNGEYGFTGAANQLISYFKTDSDGHLLPTSILTYGEGFSDGYRMIQLAPNEIIIGGGRFIPGGTPNFLFIKSDETGNASAFTIDVGGTDFLTNLLPMSSSSFLMTGNVTSMGTTDGYLALIDSESATPHIPVWGELYSNINLNAVVPTQDGGYLAVGNDGNSKLFLVKTDSTGKTN